MKSFSIRPVTLPLHWRHPCGRLDGPAADGARAEAFCTGSIVFDEMNPALSALLIPFLAPVVVEELVIQGNLRLEGFVAQVGFRVENIH